MTVFSKYTEQNIKEIQRLNPTVQIAFLEFLWRMAMRGIYFRITSGKRTSEEQHKLHLQGRETPGQKVTNADWDESDHVWGFAIDIVPLQKVGIIEFKAIWSFKGLDKIFNYNWETIGGIAKECGLQWGGDWKNPDRPHIYYNGGLTINELRAGRKVSSPAVGISKKDKKVLRVYERLKRRGILV